MREPQPPRVELFARAAVSGAQTRQREILDRLSSLEAAGHVAGTSRHTWEGRVRTPADSERATQAVEWFERFERWADETGVELAPFFERHERTSAIADETYEEFVFPVVCLAVMREGSLDRVVPHRDDGVVGVEDCLDALAATGSRGAAGDDAERGYSTGANR